MDISDSPPIGVDQWPDRNTATGGDSTPIDDIECTNPVPDDYHVHAHLSFIVNGEQKAVPPEIGFVSRPGQSRCIYGMHTHDKSGKIHMEASAPRSYTLGQFFRIWGMPLEATDVAGYQGMPIRLYVVDEAETVTEVQAADWPALQLTSHMQLTFEIGTPIDVIPNYTWSAH